MTFRHACNCSPTSSSQIRLAASSVGSDISQACWRNRSSRDILKKSEYRYSFPLFQLRIQDPTRTQTKENIKIFNTFIYSEEEIVKNEITEKYLFEKKA